MPGSSMDPPDQVPLVHPSLFSSRNSTIKSKPRTLMRMLTTKLSPAVRAPPSSAYSKEQRQAALRERGLLPPLRKDLSSLEREQDARIPVVQNDERSPDSPSAADIIKQEWASKLVNLSTDVKSVDAGSKLETDPFPENEISDRSPQTNNLDSLLQGISTELQSFIFSSMSDVTTSHPKIPSSPPSVSNGRVAKPFEFASPTSTQVSPLMEESVSSMMTPSLEHSSQSTDANSSSDLVDSLLQSSDGKAVQGSDPVLGSPTDEFIIIPRRLNAVQEELEEKPEPVVSQDDLRSSRRGSSESTPDRGLNLFKRAQTIYSRNRNNRNTDAGLQRRSTLAASFTKVRSVVGSFSRSQGPKSASRSRSTSPKFVRHTPHGRKTPPSLTTVRSEPLPGRRQAVSPVMYNNGSILLAASKIEDEESRRVAELAFM